MMDLDRLDTLPKFEKFPDHSWDNDDYWGKGFPYRRLMRWIESQVGTPIDQVISEFVRLKWLLPEYRTIDRLRKYLELLKQRVAQINKKTGMYGRCIHCRTGLSEPELTELPWADTCRSCASKGR